MENFTTPDQLVVDGGSLTVEQIVMTVVYAIVLPIGLIGNTLVLLVIFKVHWPKQQGLSNTHMMMLNLSLADLVFILFNLPSMMVVNLSTGWTAGRFTCHFHLICETTTMFASAWTLVALSVDRFIAIVYALKSSTIRTRTMGYASLAFIWTLSIALGIPAAFTKVYYTEEYLNQYALTVNSSKRYSVPMCLESQSEWIKWYRLSTFILGYSLPLILITCCYSAVLRRLYIKSKVKIKDRKSQDAMLHKVTKIVVVLVILFTTDWVLYHVMKLWRHFDPTFEFTTATISMEIAGQLLAYSNACINPVVYAFVSKGFRNDFGKVVDLSKVGRRMTLHRGSTKDGGNTTQFTLAESSHNSATKQKLLKGSADCCKKSLDVRV